MKTCGLNQQEVRLESVAVDDRTSEHVYYGGYSLFHLWCKMVQELDNSWVYQLNVADTLYYKMCNVMLSKLSFHCSLEHAPTIMKLCNT